MTELALALIIGLIIGFAAGWRASNKVNDQAFRLMIRKGAVKPGQSNQRSDNQARER